MIKQKKIKTTIYANLIKNKMYNIYKKVYNLFLNLTDRVLRVNNKMYNLYDKRYNLFLLKNHDIKYLNHLQLLINKKDSYSYINNSLKIHLQKVYNQYLENKLYVYVCTIYFFVFFNCFFSDVYNNQKLK